MRSTLEGGPEPYIQIGAQRWQRRNLDVSTYRNGDIIPYIADNTKWSNLSTGAWCYYNNDPELGKIYGKIYNWFAVTDPRGLAPEGWHIPDYSECTTLFNEMGGVGNSTAGGRLKEAGTTYWNSPNTDATNSSGFTALPGGWRPTSFANSQNIGYWWSSTQYNSTDGKGFYLSYNTGGIGQLQVGKGGGCSVRCIKD